jgi:hypothetical protein
MSVPNARARLFAKGRLPAGKFPWPFFMVALKPEKDGGGWLVKEF